MSAATFTPDQAQARLAAELPRWRCEGAWILRRYKTAGWKGTLMLVNTIGHLAEAAWHHPDLTVGYDAVTVRLQTHDAQGLTEKDFALARKIEEVLMWRPASETTLEGTPQDPRYQYVSYD